MSCLKLNKNDHIEIHDKNIFHTENLITFPSKPLCYINFSIIKLRHIMMLKL